MRQRQGKEAKNGEGVVALQRGGFWFLNAAHTPKAVFAAKVDYGIGSDTKAGVFCPPGVYAFNDAAERTGRGQGNRAYQILFSPVRSVFNVVIPVGTLVNAGAVAAGGAGLAGGA